MMDTCDIRYSKYDYGDASYDAALVLRNEVLRIPLGRSLFNEDLSREVNMLFFGAFCGDTLIGTLQFSFDGVPEGVAHLAQVAVSPSYRGKGIGRALLTFAEQTLAKERNISCIDVHARENAVGFYLACQYTICSEPFVEVGIRHRQMKKEIS